MKEELSNNVLGDFQDLTVTSKDLPLSNPEQDNSIVMEAQDLTVTERVNPIDEDVSSIEEDAMNTSNPLPAEDGTPPSLSEEDIKRVVANMAMTYDAGPEDAIDITKGMILSTMALYPDVVEPMQLMRDVFSPQSFEYISQNVNMRSIEMIQQKHQDEVVKKAQASIKDELEKHNYAMKLIDKLPQGYKDFLQAEWKDEGRTFSDAVKELQIMSGVKADGWLGEGTLKALKSNFHFKGVPTAAKVSQGEDNVSMIDDMVVSFGHQEGSGDSLTSVKTGNLGVTEAIKKKYGVEKTDKEVAKLYLTDLNKEITKMNPNMPNNLRVTLLDTLYNTGAGALKWSSIKEFISNPSESTLQTAILTKIYSEGKSVKGIGKRRAEAYNKSNPSKRIASVEQKSNGDMIYRDSKGDLIFEAPTTKERHTKSTPGIIKI